MQNIVIYKKARPWYTYSLLTNNGNMLGDICSLWGTSDLPVKNYYLMQKTLPTVLPIG